MKSFAITLTVLCAVAIAAAVCLKWHRTNPQTMTPAALVETTESTSAGKTTTPESAPPPINSARVAPEPTNTVTPVVETKPAEAPQPSALTKTIDALISPQTDFLQRQAILKTLKVSGAFDEVIGELKQRALANPQSAEIPIALGEAQIAKLNAVKDSGGDYSEIGILALQADQNFSVALNLDPTNWEAQFFKAALMSHLPADMNKDAEVAQRLSSLIDQQETMPSQPQFARTYVLLGEQYQKAGKTDYAQATWRIGLEKFPSDPTLQRKIRAK